MNRALTLVKKLIPGHMDGQIPGHMDGQISHITKMCSFNSMGLTSK
jgi:hypothetical protein